MNHPEVTIIVCGRFHFHKYLKFLFQKKVLKKFVYSYKIDYKFDVDKTHLKNYPLKEYLMYFGMRFLKGVSFYRYLSFLHRIWQQQVITEMPEGNVVHFLVQGNCYEIIKKHKQKGIKVIGEVVNVHPIVQERLLQLEYENHGLTYQAGEKQFKQSIMRELSLCDYWLAPSTFVKESFVNHGINAEKIKVIPYGLESVKRVKSTSFIERNKKIKMLCIGQISFRKGIVYLLRAHEALIKEGYDCDITLVGHTNTQYLPVISRYIGSKNVHCVNHIDNSKVQELMIIHDLLIMPSIEDGFGVVVVEALAVHLPVIVTKNCGASEVIVNGKNGFVIEAFSEVEISKAIVRSIEYPFVFDSPVSNWSEYSNQLIQFYKSVQDN